MSNNFRETRRMTNGLATAALAALLYLATAGGLPAAPTEYPTGVTINNPDKAFKGWTLFNFMADKKIVLIDMDGNVINTWEYPTGNRFGPLGYPLPNGRILALCGNTQGRGICEMDWNGKLLWEFYHVDWGLNHDFERIPGNGNTIVLAKVDGLYPLIAPYQIRNDQLEEVTKDGDVVWSWSTAEHYDQIGISDEGRDEIYSQNQYFSDKTDIFHTNSIQRLPNNRFEQHDPRFAQGNILVSERNTSRVFIIDRNSGDIVWRLSDCLQGDLAPIGQHHVSMIPKWLPGDGDLLIYDNGGIAGFPIEVRWYTRTLEVDPTSCEVVWQYNSTKNGKTAQAFFSNSRGSAQRLPNGNTLISEPIWLRIFEITPEGEIVWEYVHEASPPDEWVRKTENIYRAYRVAEGWGVTEKWPDPSGKSHFVW